MLQNFEIANIVRTISEKLKVAKGNDHEEADWGELYKKSCQHADEVEVHACGDFPTKLIGANFPGETNEERDYRKSSFQPVTKPYWQKAMKMLNRIWAEQNYVIDWNNDDAAKKYFTEDFPISDSIISYFKTIVTTYKITEPNGVLCITFDIPQKEIDGTIIPDDTQELAPYCIIYDTDDVIMYQNDRFALVVSDEKTDIQYGNGTVKQGYVFYLYDNENIYRIYQVGKKVDWTFQTDIYYQHNLGYVPAWKLKGTPDDVIDNSILYTSYFSPALPHLNEALIIHSTNKAVRNKVSYPTRVYYDQKCNNNGCSGGKIWVGEGEDMKQENCPTCKGTGSVRISPFTDYVHQAPTATNDTGVQSMAFPGMTYVSPDGAIIQQNEDVIDKYLQTAFSFLNIEVMNGNQKGLNDPTATKSKIDRDEQYISMLDISNELFQLLYFSIDAIYQLRYRAESPIKIKPPVNFDLLSGDELTTRLTTAKTAKLPDMAVSEMTVQLMQQEYSVLTARKAEIAQYCDVLWVKDTADISIMQTNGNVEKWQVILHNELASYLDEMIEADAVKFMATSFADIKTQVVEKAKLRAAELEAGKQSADNILSGMAQPAL